MHTKTHKIQHTPHIKIPHLTLRNSWLTETRHLRLPSRARLMRFRREYSLPLVATICFVVVVSGVAVLRASERAALIQLLPSISEINQEYSRLLSGDKADEFTKNQDNTDSVAATVPGRQTSAPAGSASSTTINTGTTSSSDGTTTGGGSSSGGGGTPAPVFSSSITSFQQTSVTLVCDGLVQVKNKCSKRYVFSAGIRTNNGPGSVNYSWRSNYSIANQDASFSAGAGTANTPLQKQFDIPCKNNDGTYTLQLAVVSPTQAQSSTLSVNHNCNGI